MTRGKVDIRACKPPSVPSPSSQAPLPSTVQAKPTPCPQSDSKASKPDGKTHPAHRRALCLPYLSSRSPARQALSCHRHLSGHADTRTQGTRRKRTALSIVLPAYAYARGGTNRQLPLPDNHLFASLLFSHRFQSPSKACKRRKREKQPAGLVRSSPETFEAP